VQVLGELAAGVVAAVGATGYVIALGAIVTWIRLGAAGFAKAVPLSFASREELLVVGAQALTVWLILAGALIALAARLMTNQDVGRPYLIVVSVLGVSATVATQAAVAGPDRAIAIPVLVVLSGVIVALAATSAAVRLAPATWVTPLLAVVLGIALPVAVHEFAEQDGVGTSLAAWVAFGLVLWWLPPLRRLSLEITANETAIGHLEADDPALDPGAPPTAERNRRRLLVVLRQQLAAAKRRFWARALCVGVGALIALGLIAIGSQFEKQKLFRTAFVTLDTGRCVTGTYLSRNKEQLVIGDQQGYTLKRGKVVRLSHAPPNKVVVFPAAHVVKLEVRDPSERGVKMINEPCPKDGSVFR
jgi:hypothetical protein